MDRRRLIALIGSALAAPLARGLGLAVPQSLLLRADRVIE